MSDSLNAWLVLDRTWRSAISAIWRFPLLLLACWFGDVLVSSYAFRLLPVAAANDIPMRIFYQAAYIGLHSFFAAPPVTAVMLMVINGHLRYSDLSLKPVVHVGVFQLGRGLLYLALIIPFWFWYFREGQVLGALYLRGSLLLALVIFYLSRSLWYFLTMLVWARLVLVLPVAALGTATPQTALVKGWRMMKGHFGFALAATILAVVPFLVLESIVDTTVYNRLGAPSLIPTGLTLHQWERLMIRGAEVMFRWLIDGALAAWIYRAIMARSGNREVADQSTRMRGASPASLSS